ncbi:S1 RNA-binding domain-containing protein, partial [Fournierella massiliensis]
MELEVGTVLEGKVTGVKKFGAFVALPEGKTGMIHISEVSNEFIQDLSAVLSEGQTVKVKVINVGEDGKIALSIKRTLPPPERP